LTRLNFSSGQGYVALNDDIFDFFAIFLEIFSENPHRPTHAWQSLKSEPSARRWDQ
jgi:hypothetical protein